MNLLIRLYGLKCHHDSRDLMSRIDNDKDDRYASMSEKKVICIDQLGSVIISSRLQLSINLRQARVKSAISSLLSMFESR